MTQETQIFDVDAFVERMALRAVLGWEAIAAWHRNTGMWKAAGYESLEAFIEGYLECNGAAASTPEEWAAFWESMK